MSEQLSELYARALAQEAKDVIRNLAHSRDTYRTLWEEGRAHWAKEKADLEDKIARLRAERDEYKGMIDALEINSKSNAGT